MLWILAFVSIEHGFPILPQGKVSTILQKINYFYNYSLRKCIVPNCKNEMTIAIFVEKMLYKRALTKNTNYSFKILGTSPLLVCAGSFFTCVCFLPMCLRACFPLLFIGRC